MHSMRLFKFVGKAARRKQDAKKVLGTNGKHRANSPTRLSELTPEPQAACFGAAPRDTQGRLIVIQAPCSGIAYRSGEGFVTKSVK